MKIFYWFLVLYLTINLIVAILREEKKLNQIGAALILILFLIRLLLIQ